jgi:Arc/MetJ-type ribon-helix-helix transcriptional regulator
MALTLDPATEQRIQQELERGLYSDPAELINHALDALQNFRNPDQTWTDEDRAALDQQLDEAIAQIQRGEGIPGDQVRDVLAARLAARGR